MPKYRITFFDNREIEIKANDIRNARQMAGANYRFHAPYFSPYASKNLSNETIALNTIIKIEKIE